MIRFITATPLLVMLTTSFAVSRHSTSQTPSKNLAETIAVGVCKEPGSGVRRIGSGKFGLQFDIPAIEVEVSGGKPDVDYVRYVIKPKNGGGTLELWFGATAFSPEPDEDLKKSSVEIRDRDVVNANGQRIGVDHSGKTASGEVWRTVLIVISGLEGARYRGPAETTVVFDRIINSACYVPFPDKKKPDAK